MLSCLVSFSLLGLDSDYADMEFGKEYFYTLTKNRKVVFFGCSFLSAYMFITLFIDLSICCFLRGGGPARPTLCPLVLLVPSVRGDGQLRPGASQQYLQETLSGEVQGRHPHPQVKSSFPIVHCGTSSCDLFFLHAGLFVRLCPPSRGSALL